MAHAIDPNKPVVDLWESVGLGLIISYPSGIQYSNQTGGNACLHPWLEGVFVPLRNDTTVRDHVLLSPENELYDFFAGPMHQGTGATSGLDEADADFVAGILADHRLHRIIQVDRTRLEESHEAWVHVLVLGEEAESLPNWSGLGPYPRRGVLTWSNTD